MSNNSKSFWDKTWKRENARFYKHFRAISTLLPEQGKVIDVGCGVGTLLKYLKKNNLGLNLEGRDFSTEAIKKLSKSGIKCKVEKLPKITGKADVIIATEVLEHMKNDSEIVKNMSKVAPIMIATVPNNCLGPEVCDEHERLYTADSLVKLVEKYYKKYVIYEVDHYLLIKAHN